MDANEIFAKNLKFYVIKSGKTQSQIAFDLGVSKGTFSDWVSGRSHPRMHRVQEIADYFGIKNSDLVENGHKVIYPEMTERPLMKKLLLSAINLAERDIKMLIQLSERLGEKK